VIPDPYIRQLPVDEVAKACQDETARYLRRETGIVGYCLELFRRAIAERDDRAWAKVVAQYRRMVLAWVGRHQDFATIGAGEDADHWVDAVFVRFWNALKPERFGQFGETRQLLAYLKMCASSVVQDELRQRQQRLVSVPLEPIGDDDPPEDYSRAIEVHDPPEARLETEELLGIIRRELRDDLERHVFELSIRLGFTPREITRRDPGRFPSAEVVYQVKRNLLERLRRSPDVRKYLSAAG
jgi:DNA-directed RNA polymerase specialized sigma24 family protein